ncbi:cupin domain-containing protein [Cognatiyoonia sp. IB215182]|uniref:cupin domain-containing protein n=1 Tax=Cognatiyoonia sp. IB215182 TaxID=3097353 RepID=UPI002A15C2EA|nr:cupin domain-containing protein [Cognatiyoonia sp. IB215182]MDX8353750.1 cupin domain-containing protein [Cognatiyoonia sp. IB215182]
MPKISDLKWLEHAGNPHPITGQNDGPYAKIALGDVIGLSQFGVHLERLPPGSRSSHRHWHEAEDEFIYVISGELILIENAETRLVAGDAAGWAGGQPIAHCLENRSGQDAVFLVVGTRLAEDIIHYPEHDLVLHRKAAGRTYTRGDGSPIEQE